jgi:hypothetical protein
MMQFEEVVKCAKAKDGIWYVGTVYTQHKAGLHSAHADAVRYCAALMAAGVRVFGPIAHSHHIGQIIDPKFNTHDFWIEAIDKPFMEVSCGMIYCLMTNWEKSEGLAREVRYFQSADKPILYWNVEDEATLAC